MSTRQPIFVIQQHRATNLHYDLRLEVDGVLASWAVPKGPSTDPKVKRLAVQVADHAISHADFEGRLGSGGVIVWDTGPYENLRDGVSMADALEDGHVSVRLHGHKLHGGFTLQRTSAGDKPHWLLIKRRDADADARRNAVSSEPESVLSGRTLEEVQRSGGD